MITKQAIRDRLESIDRNLQVAIQSGSTLYPVTSKIDRLSINHKPDNLFDTALNMAFDAARKSSGTGAKGATDSAPQPLSLDERTALGNLQTLVLKARDARGQSANDDTAFFNKRELELVLPGLLREEYSVLSAISTLPNDNRMLPDGYRYWTQRGIKGNGQAKLFRESMLEVPQITLTRTEESFKKHRIIIGYGENLYEKIAGGIVGIDMMAEKLTIAVRALAEYLNYLLYFGDDDVKLYGALTHPDIEKVSIGTAISRATSAETLATQLKKYIRETKYATEGVFGQYDQFIVSEEVRDVLLDLKLPVIYGQAGGGLSVLEELEKTLRLRIVAVPEFSASGPGGLHYGMLLRGGNRSISVSYGTPMQVDVSPNMHVKQFALVQEIGDMRAFYPRNAKILLLDYEQD